MENNLVLGLRIYFETELEIRSRKFLRGPLAHHTILRHVAI